MNELEEDMRKIREEIKYLQQADVRALLYQALAEMHRARANLLLRKIKISARPPVR